MGVIHALPTDDFEPGGGQAARETFVLPRLPAASTSFVGRDDDVQRVVALFARPGVRLVTLTGAGGIGKTRLALEVVRLLPVDVAFVELAAVSHPDLVPGVIVRALGLESTLDQPALGFLLDEIGEARLLLVLDNFEHLAEGAALVARLLTGCPNLSLLVTSRVRLGISGEHVVQVDPLALPGFDVPPTARDIERNGAVRLFVDRASAAHAPFRLTDANAAAVARICERLDGLPLAIELAAARSNLLSPESILGRLQRRLSLLTDGPADRPLRLQTMRAALAWSVDLLEPAERDAWMRLGAFEGGLTAEAAESVVPALPSANASGSGAGSASLGLLESLIRQGLLRTASNQLGEPRFAMLETARAYAAELLAASGIEIEARGRHAAWVRAFAREVEAGLMGNDGETWFYRVEAEIANVRAAFRWLEQRAESETALEIAGNLAWFWTDPGYIGEGRSWYASLLAAAGDGVSPAIRAKAHAAAGDLADWHADTAVAREHHLQALALWREAGDRKRTADALRSLGSAAIDLFAFDEAESLLAEAMLLANDVGDGWNAAAAANLRGAAAFYRGELDEAIRWHETALKGWQAIGDMAHLPTALGVLGWAWIGKGDHARAIECFDTVLEMAEASPSTNDDTFAVLGMAEVWLAHGQESVAVRLIAAALNERRHKGLPLRPPIQVRIDETVGRLRTSLGQAGFALAWSEGLAMAFPATTAWARELARSPLVSVDGLSPREREVLRLVVEGASDHEIADRLYISRRTASKHVAAILDKLGASNRTSAATIAHRRGLV